MGNRRRQTITARQWAPRDIDMLKSPAMAVLSLAGRRILDRLEIELAGHGGADNGKLPCTFDDFERFGIHRHSIGPGIREVLALGFVERTREGRAGNGEFRQPALYRLTYRNTDYGSATDEWKKIQTDEQAEAISKHARRK